jgi:thymidylate synthase ThyX
MVSPTLIAQDQLTSIKKAQQFYDRILDGYGDDSIGELGGAHLAIENVSMLAAKTIEDCRIGGSPLEKSTRYIYFDQKVQDEYRFHKEAVLMTSAWRSLYINTCNMLFDTYTRIIAPMTTFMSQRYPKDLDVSKNAYTAAIRAKVLDCVRGLLPASTLTNIGLFGNGRFFEAMLHKLQCQNLSEVREIGKVAYEELSKVIPSFVRRADSGHKTHTGLAKFYDTVRMDLKALAAEVSIQKETEREKEVQLIASDPDGVYKVAAGLLYADTHVRFDQLLTYCRELSQEELIRILDAACVAREQRRHKSPRALENAVYTFELVSDFGAYRDLQRHRMLTQERQLLSCNLGYFVPQEIIEAGVEKEYRVAMDAAKLAYDTIAKDLPEEAQYVVPMAFRVRWYMTINLRALQWLCELRSQQAGHFSYRIIAQQMARAVCKQDPLFERFFQFVDFVGHDVGRLEQEIKAEKKRT